MKRLTPLAIPFCVVAIASVAAEIGLRIADGYRLTAVRLVRSNAVTTRSRSAAGIDSRASAYASKFPVADGIAREWFARSPAPLLRVPLSPELERVSQQIASSNVTFDMFKESNTRFIQERVCAGDPFFEQFPGFAFAFDPDDASSHPRYRYLRGVTRPYGLVTNRIGFRGHEIAPDKPRGVIRIAAVGASTTVGKHDHSFSYAEFLEPWLKEWTSRYAPGVRFEVINAGREGISSTDIAALVKHDVLPLEPDLILYYEGANQFVVRNLIREAGDDIIVPADLNPRPLRGVDRFDLLRRLHIVLLRVGLGSGAEPRKPRYRLDWPASVNEGSPNPDDVNLPLGLADVVHDLDDIRYAATGSGAELVVSSFMWMVNDGLTLDPVNQADFYHQLNLRFWPARYSDIRRMADFQNRIFRAYAESRGLSFIDVAAQYPIDTALFEDPIHMTEDGDRLHAWIVWQGGAAVQARDRHAPASAARSRAIDDEIARATASRSAAMHRLQPTRACRRCRVDRRPSCE